MKKPGISLILLLFICSALCAQDSKLPRAIENLHEQVRSAIEEDRQSPDLPNLIEIKRSKAFDVELYQTSDLEEINEGFQQMLGIFTTYSQYTESFPDEFSLITSRVVLIMEVILEKAEELKEESQDGWALMLKGFGQVLQGCVNIFTSPETLPEENRLEIAKTTLKVAGRKWEYVPLEQKDEIMNILSDYRETGESKEITKWVSKFLKRINNELIMEEKGRL